ncbi:hypothetical protein GCM10023224_15680 [Streptomonospora halophila]|uniref:Uncharacterized protein n=1 Tax=Streptomonospora halophila TaxID=427369 RepID=A0ABP9GCF8_9ACTN
MAVLTVELFAFADDTTTPLTVAQQDTIGHRFTDAIAPLRTSEGGDNLVVVDCTLTPFESGVTIHALCLACSAVPATEAIAHELSLAMAAEPVFFADWGLYAGPTCIHAGDN